MSELIAVKADKLIKFNLNDYVKIKVTEKGWEEVKLKWAGIQLENKGIPTWWLPDSEGFSRIQCHEFIDTLGSCMRNGFDIPCETDIYFEIKGTK